MICFFFSPNRFKRESNLHTEAYKEKALDKVSKPLCVAMDAPWNEVHKSQYSFPFPFIYIYISPFIEGSNTSYFFYQMRVITKGLKTHTVRLYMSL